MMGVTAIGLLIMLNLAVIVKCNCCNDQCITQDDTLNCDDVCTGHNLCIPDSRVKHLSLRNNNLGERTDFRFQHMPRIKTINLENNKLNRFPNNLFLNLENLEEIDLQGNDFDEDSFDIPIQHKLKKIRGLQLNCINEKGFKNFKNLEEIEVTMTSREFCKEIFMANVTTLELTLSNIREVKDELFELVRYIRNIILIIPQVRILNEGTFRHLEHVKELTIKAPELVRINGYMTKGMSKLTKIKIIAPKLTRMSHNALGSENNNTENKIQSIELCPVERFPYAILYNQRALNEIKTCNFEHDTHLGIPTENLYKNIVILNSNVKILPSKHRYLPTFYTLHNDGPASNDAHKIKVEMLTIANASITDSNWNANFDKNSMIHLNLSHNQLKEINNRHFKNCTNMLSLDLGNNIIERIEESTFTYTPKLRVLNLTKNHITTINTTVFWPLTELKTLDLSYNRIQVIDFDVIYNGDLKLLDVSFNIIQSIKQSGNEIWIDKVNLNGNELDNFDNLTSERQKIRELYMNRNNILTIPKTLPKNLKKIDLRFNPINCSCQNIGHVRDMIGKLIENDQIAIIKNFQRTSCNNKNSSIIQATNLCSNLSIDINMDREFQVRQSKTGDFFYPSIGVMLQNYAKLATSNDLILSTMFVPIPQKEELSMIDLTNLKELCNMKSDAIDVDNLCNRYIPEAQQRLRELKLLGNRIKGSMANLHKIAYTVQDNNITPGRNKRFILAGIQAISSIATSFGKIYSEFITKKRIKNIQKSVQILQSNVLANTQDVLVVKKDMATYQATNLKRFKDLTISINDLNNRTNQLAVEIGSYIGRVRDNIAREIADVRHELAINVIKDKLNLMIDENFREYENILRVTENTIKDIADLRRGKLSPTIIPPVVLQEHINNAKKMLKESNSEFKLIFDNAQDLYTLDNVGFAASEQLGLVVQVPLFLTQKSFDFMNLYRINTIQIPLDQTQRTQIETEHRFIATRDDQYTTFSQDQFELCKAHANKKIYICPHNLMIRDKESKSCESLIYFNGSKEEIYERCHIKFYPEDVEDRPELIEFDDNILLSHVHGPISWNCKNTVNNAEEIEYKLEYTIIKNSALCGCDLITKDFFIPMKSCIHSKDSAKLHYVVNALAYVGMKKLIKEKFTDQELSKLFDKKPKITYPSINITKLIKIDPLYALERDIALDFKEVALTMNHEHNSNILTENQITSFKHLYGGKTKIIGYTLLLAIIGVIGLLLAIWALRKQGRLRRLIYAIIANHLPMSEGRPVSNDDNENLTEPDYMTITATMIGILIICDLGYIFMRWAIRKIANATPTLQTPKIIRSPHKCRMFITLSTYCDRIVIPLCQIYALPDVIKLEGFFKMNNISIERKCLRSKLIIDWEHNLKLKVENYSINLPTEVAVSPLKAWKIKELMKTDLITKLVMVDATNVAYIMGSALLTDNIENAMNNRKALTLKEKKAILLKEKTDTENVEHMTEL